MENFKRSVKRLLTRLTVLGLVVICGAIAIAQVQKQNNANAADNAGAAKHLAVGGTSEVDPLQADGQAGLRVRSPQADGAINQDAPVPRVHQVQQVRFDSPELDEPQAPAEREFVQDASVVRVQATNRDFGNEFDSEFNEPVSSTSGFDSGPPSFDDGPPAFDGSSAEFGNAPELIGGGDVSSIADGPLPPDSTQLDAGFPEGDIGSSSAPVAAVGDPAVPRPRFGGGDAGRAARSPRASRFGGERDPQVNTLREPRFGSRFSAGDSTQGGDMRAVEPRTLPREVATRAVAQPAPLETTPPVTSSNSFGGFGGNAADSFADTAGETSLSISGGGSPVPEFNGPQSASLTIHKKAPRQVHVDEPATFTIVVRNNGSVAADRVIVRDQVPKGAKLLKTDPPAKQAANGGIYWELDTLSANQERTVTMQVIPETEGLIGSVAELSFVTLASAQAEVRKPMLSVKHTTAEKVLVGETVRFAIVIDNPGSGVAKDVMIEEDVPQGLAHTKGSRLEYKVGDIAPNGQRRLELSLKAAEPGPVANLIRARGANGLIAEHTVNLEVVAPQLNVVIDGPSTRYLERKATYTVQLENRGTASAKNIDLRVQLPRGVKFVSTESNGRYDSSTHSIHWLLRELQPNKRAPVQLTVNPQQKGDFSIEALATADRGLRDETDHPLAVDGLAALLFEVADQVDPIEVGGVTTYSIQVTNQGTKEANNVMFVAQVPPGMQAVQPTGVSKYQVESASGIVRFEPITRLAAKEKASYTIQVRGTKAGDQRFKVQMTSSETQQPVIEEESTRVYSDQ